MDITCIKPSVNKLKQFKDIFWKKYLRPLKPNWAELMLVNGLLGLRKILIYIFLPPINNSTK